MGDGSEWGHGAWAGMAWWVGAMRHENEGSAPSQTVSFYFYLESLRALGSIITL